MTSDSKKGLHPISAQMRVKKEPGDAEYSKIAPSRSTTAIMRDASTQTDLQGAPGLQVSSPGRTDVSLSTPYVGAVPDRESGRTALKTALAARLDRNNRAARTNATGAMLKQIEGRLAQSGVTAPDASTTALERALTRAQSSRTERSVEAASFLQRAEAVRTDGTGDGEISPVPSRPSIALSLNARIKANQQVGVATSNDAKDLALARAHASIALRKWETDDFLQRAGVMPIASGNSSNRANLAPSSAPAGPDISRTDLDGQTRGQRGRDERGGGLGR